MLSVVEESAVKCFDGWQRVYSHQSVETRCLMTFGVFVPDQAADGTCPVLWYLSGLTCNHENVLAKAGLQRLCSDAGVILIAPDTSPRGEKVPDDENGRWDMGQGAGFYLDATQSPWKDNYRMYSYIAQELPSVITELVPADMDRQAITGHSMGGCGALGIALQNPGRFCSVSAFAPIVNPSATPWGRRAFSAYLGTDELTWKRYDPCALASAGANGFSADILISQGDGDNFYPEELQPEAFVRACREGRISLQSNVYPDYDHSYYFVSSFVPYHFRWHVERF